MTVNQSSLAELLAGMVTQPLPPSVMIDSLALDSRQVKPAALFFAYRGSTTDGKRFIAEAVARGAAAVVVDEPVDGCVSVPLVVVNHLSHKVGMIAARFYRQPSRALTVIGVTGTNGKSSVCYFLAQALQKLGRKTALMTTVGQGVLPVLQPMARTTMDALSLQAALAQFVAQQIDVVVIEVSSHALDQGRVNAVAFDYAVLTNISREHLDYHDTMSDYSACKRQLFNWPTLKGAVLNNDDDYGQHWLNELAPALSRCSYSLQQQHSDLFMTAKKLEPTGIQAIVNSGKESGQLSSYLVGEFNAANLLAVMATLRLLNFSLAQSLAVIPQLQAAPGRMQPCRSNNQPLVIIDYAHTPDALAQTLIALRQNCRGHLYCLFGCGGDRDRGKRPQMAAIVEQYTDHIIVTDDNPRSEPSQQIIADILAGFNQTEHVQVEPDRRAAIALAIAQADVEDVVLLAGKGHECYQEIKGEFFPFDEQAIVQDCFNLESLNS
ncbi:MAG: UDP-N-acetylmuramoyl-L-alanyl-D-glutamate--2,6-diaminopimelate ligase [Gammaproteobacteria bacterium]|nr:UDP-N-acetylmuramoyl-L-alanyl-D-glutamate--2,6-diaminopimelate ligase [Gammaproteobacteria bacterium]